MYTSATAFKAFNTAEFDHAAVQAMPARSTKPTLAAAKQSAAPATERAKSSPQPVTKPFEGDRRAHGVPSYMSREAEYLRTFGFWSK